MIGVSDMDAAILVADDIDEQVIVSGYAQFRRCGMATKLIGKHDRPIRGQSGLQLLPHRALADLRSKETEALRVVVLPRSRASALLLLTDPRIFRLIEQCFVRNGVVASLSAEAQALLADFGLLTSARLHQSLSCGEETVEQFVVRVVDSAEMYHRLKATAYYT